MGCAVSFHIGGANARGDNGICCADARGCNAKSWRREAKATVTAAAPRRHLLCTGDARGPDHGKEVKFSMAGTEATSFGEVGGRLARDRVNAVTTGPTARR